MIWMKHMTNRHNTERCIFPCGNSNWPETKALYPCKWMVSSYELPNIPKVGLRFWQQRLFRSPPKRDKAKLPGKNNALALRMLHFETWNYQDPNSFVDQSMKLEPPHVLFLRTREAASLGRTFLPLTKLHMSTMKRHSSFLRDGHRRPSSTEGITATRHIWAKSTDTRHPYELRERH